MDIAIPLVFPDYRITFETSEYSVDLPNWLPGVPDEIKIPKTKSKISQLGHAGVLYIRGMDGLTRYYEYGRYDPQHRGMTMKRPISNVVMKGGRPTQDSLRRVLAEISRVSGQQGSISGALVEIEAGFSRMEEESARWIAANRDPKRTPYAILSHSCLHFMKAVVEAGGASMPPAVLPHPNGYIELVQMLHTDLEFSPTGGLVIEDFAETEER